MSDERDSADAAGADGTEDTTGGQTVVVSRPQRPTGKRTRQRGATALAEPEEVESGAEELGVEEKAKKAKPKKPKKATREMGSRYAVSLAVGVALTLFSAFCFATGNKGNKI